MTARVLRGFFTALAATAATLVFASPGSAAAPRVLAVNLDNDINPVTAEYVTGEISRASREGYDAVVIVLDTPGGLSESMRKIVKARARIRGAGRRLRRPRRSARRVGGRLDRRGGRCPGDGATDEHRLVDADLDRR